MIDFNMKDSFSSFHTYNKPAINSWNSKETALFVEILSSQNRVDLNKGFELHVKGKLNLNKYVF